MSLSCRSQYPTLYRKIHETGGNAVDAMVATEFCISAVHPHTTGPGFGAVIVLHSKLVLSLNKFPMLF